MADTTTVDSAVIKIGAGCCSCSCCGTDFVYPTLAVQFTVKAFSPYNGYGGTCDEETYTPSFNLPYDPGTGGYLTSSTSAFGVPYTLTPDSPCLDATGFFIPPAPVLVDLQIICLGGNFIAKFTFSSSGFSFGSFAEFVLNLVSCDPLHLTFPGPFVIPGSGTGPSFATSITIQDFVAIAI